MTYKIPSEIKFADDINVWSTNHDPAIAASDLLMCSPLLLKLYLGTISGDCFLVKTKQKLYASQKTLIMRLKSSLINTIEQVSSKLCLWVVLDENLHFSKHISYACSKAIKALNKVCIFLSNTDGLNTRNSIILHK